MWVEHEDVVEAVADTIARVIRYSPEVAGLNARELQARLVSTFEDLREKGTGMAIFVYLASGAFDSWCVVPAAQWEGCGTKACSCMRCTAGQRVRIRYIVSQPWLSPCCGFCFRCVNGSAC